MDLSVEEQISTSSASISDSELPNDDPRQPYEKKRAAYFILASTLFERIAFYTISANFVSASLYTSYKWNEQHIMIASFLFSGVSYVGTLLFAIISDAKFGRYKTILFGFCLYIIGYIWATLIAIKSIHLCDIQPQNSTSKTDEELCFTQIFPTLLVIAIGASATQASMPVFGVEQLDRNDIQTRYFDKHVIIVNTSAIIAKLIISLIIDTNEGHLFIGYIFATICLLIAILLIVFGRRYFRHGKPYDSVVIHFIPVIRNAYNKWREYKTHKHSMHVRTNLTIVSISSSTDERDNALLVPDNPRPSFLDFAKIVNHGNFQDRIVDDVKSLRNALIVFSLLIPYWIIYDQLYTTFPAQRLYMSSPSSSYNTTTSIAISIGDSLTIIIGLVIFNVCNLTLLIQTRFIIGMILACLTMVLAGSVEIIRQQQCMSSNTTSDLSIFVQLPQNISLGLSELFVMAASFEFAYYASRRAANSLFMSLRFCSIGMSSFLSSTFIFLFSFSSNFALDFKCQDSTSTDWRLYSYFYIIGGSQLIFIIFIVVRKKFAIIQRSLH